MAIEYRWAENQIDRLPALAAELVRRQVAVIVATGSTPSALATKAATTTIPIVFGVREDPVRLGLVASLARPDGNLTGVNVFSGELVAKRLELLRELVPATTRVAVLVNPAEAVSTETTVRDVEAAARAIGLSSDGRLLRSHTQGHQTCGPAGRAVEQIGTGDQRTGGQDARPYRAALAAPPRRRSDRMSLLTSGTLLPSQPRRAMSVIWGRPADICSM